MHKMSLASGVSRIVTELAIERDGLSIPEILDNAEKSCAIDFDKNASLLARTAAILEKIGIAFEPSTSEPSDALPAAPAPPAALTPTAALAPAAALTPPARAPPTARAPPPATGESRGDAFAFAAGDAVDVRWTNGAWYPAHILEVDEFDASRPYRVHYKGWPKRWDEWAPTADLRFTIRADAGTRADAGIPVGAKRSRGPGPAWSVGDRVLAKWAREKRRYPGVVAKVHGDGTYDVKYDDDGDVDAGLEAAYIEAAPAPPAPRRTRVSGDLV